MAIFRDDSPISIRGVHQNDDEPDLTVGIRSTFSPKKQSENGSSKILLITAAVFILVIGLGSGFSWWSAKNKSHEQYVKALDALNNDHTEEAIKNLDEAISLDDSKAEYYYTRGHALWYGQEKAYEAELNFDKAIQLAPKNPEYSNAAGEVAFGNQEFAKAEQRFKTAMALDSKNITYPLNLAGTYVGMGNHNEAIKVYQKILKADPKNETAWESLAACYFYQNKMAEYLAVRQKSVSVNPNSAFLWYGLGLTYAEQKQVQPAVNAFKKVITLDPNSAVASAEQIFKLTGEKVKAYSPAVDVIALKADGSSFRIKTIFANKYHATMLLDTGASDTLLYEGFIEQSGIHIPANAPVSNYGTASGVVEARILYLDLQVGQQHLKNIRVAVIPTPAGKGRVDGLLGLNALNRFKYEIDPSAQTITLKRG